jgi:hypothetical protein
LRIRNWPCNPLCALCDQVDETAEHLCLHCVFAREVWDLVSRWTDALVQVPASSCSLELWWNSCLQAAHKEHKRQVAAVLIYTSWNLWKERNRHIFDQVAVTPARCFFLIKEELNLRSLAFGEQGTLRDLI